MAQNEEKARTPFIEAYKRTIKYNGIVYDPEDGPFAVTEAYAKQAIGAGIAVEHVERGVKAPEGSLTFLKKSVVALLAKNDIFNVEDAEDAGVSGMTAIKGIGKKTAKEIVAKIHQLYE